MTRWLCEEHPPGSSQGSGVELGLVHEGEMGLSQDVPTIAPCDD